MTNNLIQFAKIFAQVQGISEAEALTLVGAMGAEYIRKQAMYKAFVDTLANEAPGDYIIAQLMNKEAMEEESQDKSLGFPR